MAPAFVGLDDVARDIWVPITTYGDLLGEDLFGPDQPRVLHVTTRLRHDITSGQAQASVTIAPFETRVPGRVDAVRAQPSVARHADTHDALGVCVPVAGLRRIRAGPRRGVCQRVERDAGPRERPAPGDRHTSVNRGEPLPDRSAAADRRPADCHARRRGGPCARRRAASQRRLPVRVDAAGDGRGTRAIRSARFRLSRVPVHVCGGSRRDDPVCAAARAAGDSCDADRCAQGTGYERCPQLDAARRARHEPGGGLAVAAHRGRHAGTQRQRDSRHRTRASRPAASSR